jgi:4-oxalomesaconate tautomerase
MNLGDVGDKTVPKMSLVSPATYGGTLSTRTFIPHRVHQAIGVLGAASVAAACCIPGSVAFDIAAAANGGALDIEHPTGRFTVGIDIAQESGEYRVRRSALLRTARKLMDGCVYAPERN